MVEMKARERNGEGLPTLFHSLSFYIYEGGI